ncbi:MAG TPA: TIGR03435 family protein [Bryobacteraceae bacterium]
MRIPKGYLVLAAFACLMRAGEAHFEAATVKPSGPESATRRFLIEGRRFATFHTSLADLVQFAYGLHPRQIAHAPGWLTSAQFDVAGTVEGDSKPSEQEWMKMMGALLADRFQLRFHLEKRELRVYAIVVDRNARKLKLSDRDPSGLPSLGFHGRGQLIARNATVADLAWELESAVLDRPVVDQTGLPSKFDFTLSWSPDEFQSPAVTGADGTTQEVFPHLFTAIRQQLGLRLKASNARVDVMVIEHAAIPERDQ